MEQEVCSLFRQPLFCEILKLLNNIVSITFIYEFGHIKSFGQEQPLQNLKGTIEHLSSINSLKISSIIIRRAKFLVVWEQQ